MSGIILIVLLFAFIMLDIPITFALGLASLVFFLMHNIPLATFAQKLAISVDSFPLLALPFFVLAGNLMNNGGITRRLFGFANSVIGCFRGGLSYVCIVSSMIFSALSGSALANAAGLGSIQIKAMSELDYPKEFSACLTASAAILGPIIPPSVIMIIYGVTAGVSIRSMFMGGIMPGILLCLMYAGMCFYFGKKLNLPKGAPFSFKTAWRAFKEAAWALMTPVVILGGIFSGMFSATEAGAVACLYSFLVGLFVYKDLKLKDMAQVIFEAGKVTGLILFIAATASVFAFCLTYARLPQTLAAFLVQHIDNMYMMLFIFTLVYFFLGTIMEATPIVITTVPIFVPLCLAMKIDLIYFGVYVGILMAIGCITPPVGTAMFVICKNAGLSIERFSRFMIPWFMVIALFVLILAVFPQVIMTIPTMFR